MMNSLRWTKIINVPVSHKHAHNGLCERGPVYFFNLTQRLLGQSKTLRPLGKTVAAAELDQGWDHRKKKT